MSQFALGAYVRKKSGSFWEGTVVGHYSTDQTPDGVAVQLFGWPNGPVQIYPAAALEAFKAGGVEGERCPGSSAAVAPENHDAPDGDWQKAASGTDSLGFAVEQIAWRGRRATIVDRDFPIGTPITTATRQTSSPSLHVAWGDWTVDDTDTAREILNYMGYGSDASREPGADRRRDKIAAMIRARIDAATSPAPEKHVWGEAKAEDCVLSIGSQRVCAHGTLGCVNHHAQTPTTNVEAEIARVVQSVNEWDDRTSPDDYPEHLLITSEELANILRNFAATLEASDNA